MDVRTSINILISSSRQWNPGDEFIALGARRMIGSVLRSPINYILWNRNPDLFVDRWRDSYFRPGFLTNSASEPSLDLIDLVVLAGTPEWFGRPVERIFRELLRFPDVPLLAIGVGGAGPGFAFSPLEREIFMRENAMIICRNPVLAEEINEQIGPGKAWLMPCPAFFCSPAARPRSIGSFAKTRPAVSLQGDGVQNQSAPVEFVDQVTRFIVDSPDISETRFVAHYIDEFLRFSRVNRQADIFYSYEPLDYVGFYRDGLRALLASRLHGAIASLSAGTPACLVDFGSDRMNDAAIPFDGLLPCLEFEDAVRWMREQTPEKCARTSANVIEFKERISRRYLDVLGPFLTRFVPPEGEALGAFP